MKYNYKFVKLSCFILGFSLLGGCAKDHVAENHQYMPHKENSYVIRGHNYSFAIYNGEHRLLTHPIEDLLTEMKWRKSAQKNPSISDIFIVSHGWNYTLPVAIANYHSYMERVDALMKKQKNDNKFQPYFIFVTWTSTTRPTTDLIKAVLPFGIDSSVEPITSIIDKAPLHILTAWKQSINAAQNALGANNPNYYLKQDWSETPYGYLGSNLIVDDDFTMGEDLPVSALIYKLIQKKNKDKPTLRESCNIPDPFDPADDDCVSLSQTKLHLAGHSYGAKLVAMAGMEALRRWMLDGLASELADKKYTNKSCVDKIKPKDDGITKKDDEHTKYFECLSLSPLTGHLRPFGELFKTFRTHQPSLLNAWYNKQKNHFPIDSLVLFNPAFSPGELSYPVESIISAPTETLKFIPRKAIVYSNSDYANGALYGIRDTILNAQLSQYYQSVINEVTQNHDKLNPLGKLLTSPPIKPLFEAGVGAGSLGFGVAYSLLGYAGSSVINIPFDFWYHIQKNTLDGLYESISSSKNDSELELFLKGAINTIDFFIPIKLTRIFNNTTHGWEKLPFTYLRAENEQGLYRLNRPGLGKTGVNNLTDGRWKGINLWGLADYDVSESFGDYQGFGKAINIDADTFCKFSSSQLNNKDYVAGDMKDGELSVHQENFYSYDASKVYDSMTPPVGAHSDLRETASPNGENCWNESTLENSQLMEKREYTINFLLNFTKTKLVSSIKNQESASKIDSINAQEEKP